MNSSNYLQNLLDKVRSGDIGLKTDPLLMRSGIEKYGEPGFIGLNYGEYKPTNQQRVEYLQNLIDLANSPVPDTKTFREPALEIRKLVSELEKNGAEYLGGSQWSKYLGTKDGKIIRVSDHAPYQSGSGADVNFILSKYNNQQRLLPNDITGRFGKGIGDFWNVRYDNSGQGSYLFDEGRKLREKIPTNISQKDLENMVINNFNLSDDYMLSAKQKMSDLVKMATNQDLAKEKALTPIGSIPDKGKVFSFQNAASTINPFMDILASSQRTTPISSAYQQQPMPVENWDSGYKIKDNSGLVDFDPSKHVILIDENNNLVAYNRRKNTNEGLLSSLGRLIGAMQ